MLMTPTQSNMGRNATSIATLAVRNERMNQAPDGMRSGGISAACRAAYDAAIDVLTVLMSVGFHNSFVRDDGTVTRFEDAVAIQVPCAGSVVVDRVGDGLWLTADVRDQYGDRIPAEVAALVITWDIYMMPAAGTLVLTDSVGAGTAETSSAYARFTPAAGFTGRCMVGYYLNTVGVQGQLVTVTDGKITRVG